MGRSTGRNQFFQPGELALVLLALVGSRPRHGYELMAELDRLFGPSYRSSPGSVYPAVAALLEAGLFVASASGSRKVYRLSAAGRAALSRRRTALAEIEVRTGARLDPDGGLGPVLERFIARVGALAGRVDPDAVDAVLEQAAAEIEQLDARSADAHA